MTRHTRICAVPVRHRVRPPGPIRRVVFATISPRSFASQPGSEPPRIAGRDPEMGTRLLATGPKAMSSWPGRGPSALARAPAPLGRGRSPRPRASGATTRTKDEGHPRDFEASGGPERSLVGSSPRRWARGMIGSPRPSRRRSRPGDRRIRPPAKTDPRSDARHAVRPFLFLLEDPPVPRVRPLDRRRLRRPDGLVGPSNVRSASATRPPSQPRSKASSVGSISALAATTRSGKASVTATRLGRRRRDGRDPPVVAKGGTEVCTIIETSGEATSSILRRPLALAKPLEATQRPGEARAISTALSQLRPFEGRDRPGPSRPLNFDPPRRSRRSAGPGITTGPGNDGAARRERERPAAAARPPGRDRHPHRSAPPEAPARRRRPRSPARRPRPRRPTRPSIA